MYQEYSSNIFRILFEVKVSSQVIEFMGLPFSFSDVLFAFLNLKFMMSFQIKYEGPLL